MLRFYRKIGSRLPFDGARQRPRRVYKDGTLCVRRHEVCFPIKQEVPFWNGYGRKMDERDGPQMCAKSDDALTNYLKETWTDDGTKKSRADTKEK